VTIPRSVWVEMATLGLSAEQAAAVVDMLCAVEEANQTAPEDLERQRASARERTRRYRERLGAGASEWTVICSQVYERDGRVCAYCGDVDGPHQIDHVLPLSRGGTNDLDNLQVACKPCNTSKGDRTVEEWRAAK
jgi:hypothetical protein